MAALTMPQMPSASQKLNQPLQPSTRALLTLEASDELVVSLEGDKLRAKITFTSGEVDKSNSLTGTTVVTAKSVTTHNQGFVTVIYEWADLSVTELGYYRLC